MLKSLQDTVREPSGTQSAIRQALMSPVGLRVAWVVVEAEEDVAVYEKFMQRNSTIVKTSEDSTGRKGYANVENLSVRFHDNLRPAKFWDFRQQALAPDWKSASTTKFIKLAEGRCSDLDIMSFVIKLKLKDENTYNVCRGHDMLNLLSLSLIDVQKYSVSAIMSKMIESYSLDDFKCTQLYASILAWQTKENVNVLVA